MQQWFNDPDIATFRAGHFYLLIKMAAYRKNLYVFFYQVAIPAIYNINAKTAMSKGRRYYFYCEQNRIRHSFRLKSLFLNLFIKLTRVQLSLRQINCIFHKEDKSWLNIFTRIMFLFWSLLVKWRYKQPRIFLCPTQEASHLSTNKGSFLLLWIYPREQKISLPISAPGSIIFDFNYISRYFQDYSISNY